MSNHIVSIAGCTQATSVSWTKPDVLKGKRGWGFKKYDSNWRVGEFSLLKHVSKLFKLCCLPLIFLGVLNRVLLIIFFIGIGGGKMFQASRKCPLATPQNAID